MTEIWKDIPNYDGFYSASTLGRIRSNARIVQASNRKMNIRERILHPSLISRLAGDGYLAVNLCSKSGKITMRTVHSLVVETFIGPCPIGKEVLHGDGVRSNCTLDNLRYGTRLENVQDAQAHGTHIKGEKVGNSKLKEADVLLIRARLTTGEGVMFLAREYGVSHTSIIGIRNRKRWAWL